LFGSFAVVGLVSFDADGNPGAVRSIGRHNVGRPVRRPLSRDWVRVASVTTTVQPHVTLSGGRPRLTDARMPYRSWTLVHQYTEVGKPAVRPT